jgi:CRP-like cAMP-binding protein
LDKLKQSVFRRGAYIYIEGDEDVEEIYIVEKGEIELKSDSSIKRYKDIIRSGEVFGFISSMCKRPRMESAIARIDSVVLSVKRERFIALVQKTPEIALKVTSYFGDELRAYNEMMVSSGNSDYEALPDSIQLFDQAEHFFRNDQHPYAYYVLKRFLELYPDQNREQVRAMIGTIEQTGIRTLSEPIRNGIYKIYADKQMIFCEDEPGDELYIIREGKVKITKISGNTEVMLSILKDGDIFGELAIVSNKPRNATAISWGPTTLLPIRREMLAQILQKSPGIINRIFLAISQRVWFTYIRLESRLYAKPITRIYVFLENKLLEQNISLKSKETVVLNFGIDELMRMTGYSSATTGEAMDFLLNDSNLRFNVGQIVIEEPSRLSTNAKFFRSRDHMTTKEMPEAHEKKAKREEAPAENDLSTAPVIVETPKPPTQEETPLDIHEETPGETEPGAMRLVSEEISFD